MALTDKNWTPAISRLWGGGNGKSERVNGMEPCGGGKNGHNCLGHWKESSHTRIVCPFLRDIKVPSIETKQDVIKDCWKLAEMPRFGHFAERTCYIRKRKMRSWGCRKWEGSICRPVAPQQTHQGLSNDPNLSLGSKMEVELSNWHHHLKKQRRTWWHKLVERPRCLSACCIHQLEIKPSRRISWM